MQSFPVFCSNNVSITHLSGKQAERTMAETVVILIQFWFQILWSFVFQCEYCKIYMLIRVFSFLSDFDDKCYSEIPESAFAVVGWYVLHQRIKIIAVSGALKKSEQLSFISQTNSLALFNPGATAPSDWVWQQHLPEAPLQMQPWYLGLSSPGPH